MKIKYNNTSMHKKFAKFISSLILTKFTKSSQTLIGNKV